jgi:hypothetical protein
MTVSGIDVASYQSSTYSTAGLSFVFVKATENTGYVNPHYAAQVAHGRSAGLVVGHYHFAHHGNAEAQADYFLAHAQLKPGDIIAYDWEEAKTTQADRDAWIKRVKAKAPTYRVVLYCNKSFWRSRDTENYAADGLWIADPNSPAGHPDVTHSWVFHQYSEAGGIDHDVANFASVAALKSWATALIPKPKPPVVVHPKPPAKVTYQPFPGAAWFSKGRKSPIVKAMHARLVAVGCGKYKSNTNTDVIGSGDVASYEAWQRKCGYKGAAAKWPPGKSTWDRLKVPR